MSEYVLVFGAESQNLSRSNWIQTKPLTFKAIFTKGAWAKTRL